MFVTLRCSKCDNDECDIARLFIPEDSLEGCTREVDDIDSDRMYNYMEEILPFVSQYENPQIAQEKLDEISSFMMGIYAHELGRKLDCKGKAIQPPRSGRARRNTESKSDSDLKNRTP